MVSFGIIILILIHIIILVALRHAEKERHVYLTCIVDIYSLDSYLAFISDNYILETSAHRRSQPHTTAHNRSQPLTTAHNRSLLLTTAHYRSQPLTAAHSRSTLTAAHSRLSRSTFTAAHSRLQPLEAQSRSHSRSQPLTAAHSIRKCHIHNQICSAAV